MFNKNLIENQQLFKQVRNSYFMNKLLENMPEITRVSSKGQLVIPMNIRKELEIKEGDMFATATSSKDFIVLKKIKNPIVHKDLVMLKQIEDAWQEIEQGKFRKMSKDKFLKTLDKW